MKKILVIILMIIFSLSACRNTLKYEVNEYTGYMSISVDDENKTKKEILFETLGVNNYYYFNDNLVFENFLDEYHLVINKKLASKYDYTFFKENDLLIYLAYSSIESSQFIFDLNIEKDELLLNVYEKYDKNLNYSPIENYKIFFIDINNKLLFNKINLKKS